MTKNGVLKRMVTFTITFALLINIILADEAAGISENFKPIDEFSSANIQIPRRNAENGQDDSANTACLGNTSPESVQTQMLCSTADDKFSLESDAYVDKNMEYREMFGLTDFQIERGSNLHGTRLAFTSQLSNLNQNGKALSLSEKQIYALASLIASGYTNTQALRALVAKDVLDLTFEQMEKAKIAEIETGFSPDINEKKAKADDGNLRLSNITGLPYQLISKTVNSTSSDTQEIELAMIERLNQLYTSTGNIELTSYSEDIEAHYAPKVVLGKPFAYEEQGDFKININNGGYSYVETDLEIPGKNGLDLVLTRQYHSDRANVTETRGYFDLDDEEILSAYAFEVFYRWFKIDNNSISESEEPDFSEEIVHSQDYEFLDPDAESLACCHAYFLLSQYEEAVDFMQSMPTGQHVGVEDNQGNICVITLVPDMITLGTLFEDDAYHRNYEDNYYVDEFGLGHGWMLGLSHLREVYSGYGNRYNLGKHFILTLADGTQYNIRNSIDDSANSIENCAFKDIEFHRCQPSDYPGATYGLYHKNGTVEYFNSAGRNIAIQNRFGNTITINYTLADPDGPVREIEIVDTLGNVVVYAEEDLGNSTDLTRNGNPYNRLWKLSLNGTTIRQYYSYTQPFEYFDASQNRLMTKTLTRLVCVSNEEEELTRYVSTPVLVRFNSFLQPVEREIGSEMYLSSRDGYDVLVPMTEAIYPNNSSSKIQVTCDSVEALGDNGYRHYIRCDKVFSVDGTESSGRAPIKEYVYGDFDNLEGKAAYNECFHSLVKDRQSYNILNEDGEPSRDFLMWNNYDCLYTFNLYGQNTEIKTKTYSETPFEQVGVFGDITVDPQRSWISQVTTYTYGNHLSTSPTQIHTIYYSASNLGNMTADEYYTYNERGDILSYTSPNSQTKTYSYNRYSIPTAITYKQNADTIIAITNDLTSDGTNIALSETAVNHIPKEKTAYRYNSSGQIIARDDYRSEAADDYVTTSYIYGSESHPSARPTQISISGVKTVSGTNALGTSGSADGIICYNKVYNDRGWIMSETDANGNSASYSYDATGRLISATHPNETGISYSYDVLHNMVTYTDAAGSRWLCTYGKSGKLLTVKDLGTNEIIQTNIYDCHDQLVERVTHGVPDQINRYYYDTTGRLIGQKSMDSDGNIMLEEQYWYEYIDGMAKTTKTITGDANAPSIVTTSYQDNMGNMVKSGIFRNGVEECDTFEYDYLGNQTKTLTAYSASRGKPFTTLSTCDHAGRPLTVKLDEDDSRGNETVITRTYDWLGNLLALKDVGGNTTTYTYDALGRVIRTQAPVKAGLTGQTDYTYDPNGNVLQERVSTGTSNSSSTSRVTNYTYDSMNRLTQVLGNAKQSGLSGPDKYQYTTYTYDDLGNIASMAVGNGSNAETTHYTYDRYSRLTAQTDALGNTQTYTYDLNGNLTSQTDRRGVTVSNTYDAMGRLASSVAGSDSLSFTYTKTGQRRSATSNGQTTVYTYDGTGALVSEVSPYATKAFTYGIGGMRTRFTVTADGTTYLDNQYTYNDLGQMTEVDSSPAHVHYTYKKDGGLANVTNGNGTTAAYTYNKANLPTEIKNKRSGVVLSTFNYTYGRDGNQLTKKDNLNRQTSYTYDGLNRLIQESMTGTGAYTNAYTYDDYSNRQTAVLDGTTTNYTYDANNRLLSTTGGTVAAYTYDAQGNQTQCAVSLDGHTTTFNYTYDGFNRLKKVSDGNRETVYTYDADGLRSSKDSGTGLERYVYDGDQLVVTIYGGQNLFSTTFLSAETQTHPAVDLIAGHTYYAYINGTLCSGAAFETAVETGGGATLFARPIEGDDETPEIPPVTSEPYIALQIGGIIFMIPENVPQPRSMTVQSGTAASIQLYDYEPSEDYTSYVRGVMLVASVENGVPTYYHYNAHGDVVQLTDGSGNVVKDYIYDAFGVELNATTSDTNLFRYCGEQFDAETGNYYLRARYYAPAIGRFTQVDPIQDGVNWYAYCAGNPVMLADRNGLQSYVICGEDQRWAMLNIVKGLAEHGVTDVVYSIVETREDFVSAWNAMGSENGREVPIEYVVIDIHGEPYSLSTKRDGGKIDVGELDAGKNIGFIFLLACNAGHLDYIDSHKDYSNANNNVAVQFAVYQNTEGVLAVDGTLFFDNYISKEKVPNLTPAPFDIRHWVSLGPEYRDITKGNREPAGFVVYKYDRNSKTLSTTIRTAKNKQSFSNIMDFALAGRSSR